MGIVISNPPEQRNLLKAFIETWPLDRVRQMTLQEYTNIGKHDTFTYMLEFGSEELGVISGRPSNKFGIWHRGRDTKIIGRDFSYDQTYAWYKKYGETAQEAFEVVRSNVVSVIEHAQSSNLEDIDEIDLDSLSKWKIAFLYSSYQVFPVYKSDIVRKIAEIFEHPNYRKANLSELHRFILEQRTAEEDFFDFAANYYNLAANQLERSYYIIGSKYGDENGNDSIDVLPSMIEKGAISTGFFWAYDFSQLVGKPTDVIRKWIDKHIPNTENKFQSARRTILFFINLKPGDIIAVKSQGSYGNLTIAAYAIVKEVNGRIYEFNDPDLGHLIHVDFLETGLYVETGLTYSQTIHKIIPGEKAGHFEKIFGSYTSTSKEDYDFNEPVVGDNLQIKNSESYIRGAVGEIMVKRVHNAIQNEFRDYIKAKFPDHVVRVEEQYVDLLRSFNGSIYLYEIKPYNSAYSCIRASIGQLMDYAFSQAGSGKSHLISVGVVEPTPKEVSFLEFVRGNLNIDFHYEHFDRINKVSTLY